MQKFRNRAGLSRRAWRSGVVLGVCLVVLLSLAAAAFGAPAGSSIHQGGLSVGLNGSGSTAASPIIDVTNGYPGMDPTHALVRIVNGGSLAATYTVDVAGLIDARPSLADVLLIRVRTASGHLVYQGGLRGLSFGPAAPLAAGQDATYSIEVSWPDRGAMDRNYENKTLSFSLRVRSVEA
jgi:hypothetical protein